MTNAKPLTVEDKAAILEQGRRDPVWWMRRWLGAEPWPVQARIAESVRDNPKTAVPSCHASGKSWLAARIALWFLYSYPESLVITTAPTGRQVKEILWKELRQAYSRAPHKLGGRLPPAASELKLTDGWLAYGFSTDDPDAFQGGHAQYVLVIVDEAPGLGYDLWPGIEGVLSSGMTRLLEIGQPVEPSGPFYEDCKPGSGVNVVHISAFDTPNLTHFGITEQDIANGTWERKITGPLPMPTLLAPAWVADRYRKWGPASPMYLARVRGEFPQSATDALIQLGWVARAQKRWEDESDKEPGGPVVLGGDIARFGEDETVAVLRRGHRAEVIWSHNQEDTMQSANRFARTMREVRPDVTAIDEIGVGAGVVDRLKEIVASESPESRAPMGRVVGLNSSDAARDSEMYANARAEWWWGLRERFEEGRIAIPPDEELAAQLTSIKYKLPSGRIQIESKDDMKKRGLSSPDRADTLMLAFAANMPSGEIIRPGTAKRVTQPWELWPTDDPDRDGDHRRRKTWM